jgi:hypothetical protein
MLMLEDGVKYSKAILDKRELARNETCKIRRGLATDNHGAFRGVVIEVQAEYVDR